jgi:hypothetical protein
MVISPALVSTLLRVVVFASLTAALAAPALAAGHPTLKVVRERPLVLHGAGFRSHEAVRVTVRMGERAWARKTQAGVRGGFTVQFPRLLLDFCATTPIRIVAHGRASGDVVARLPLRVCPPP